MIGPAQIAGVTFSAALERALAAEDDAAAILQAFSDGVDALLGHPDLDDAEAEQAVEHYEGLVGVALAAEDLAVRALSAVVHDPGVAGKERIAAAADWIREHAEDEDQAAAAAAHVLYLSLAEERMPLIVCAWGRLRCAWLRIEAEEDPGIHQRERLLLCDPGMRAAAELRIAEDAGLRALEDGIAVAEEHRLSPQAFEVYVRRQLARDEELTERQRQIACDVVDVVTQSRGRWPTLERRAAALAGWYERLTGAAGGEI